MLAHWNNPLAHALVEAICILLPEPIDGPQGFTGGSAWRDAVVCWVHAQPHLEPVLAQLDRLDRATILEGQVHGSTLADPGIPALPRELPESRVINPPDLPKLDEEKKEAPRLRFPLPVAGPSFDRLGCVEWDGRRQSCFLDSTLVALLFHPPEFVREILVGSPPGQYVATGASVEFRRAHGVTELHRTVPVRCVPQTHRTRVEIAQCLRAMHVGLTQKAGRVTTARFQELIPALEEAEQRETGRRPRRTWHAGHQEDAAEVLDELLRVFTVEGSVDRLESVWYLANTPRKPGRPDVLRRTATDRSNVVVLSPDSEHATVDVARDVIRVARWNQTYRTITLTELVRAPWLVVHVARKRCPRTGVLWRNRVDAPVELSACSGERLELVAVICRQGSRAESGHWTTYLRAKADPSLWAFVDGSKPRRLLRPQQLVVETEQTGVMFLYLATNEIQ